MAQTIANIMLSGLSMPASAVGIRNRLCNRLSIEGNDHSCV